MAPPEQTLETLVRDKLRGPVAELVRRLVPELVREELALPDLRTLSRVLSPPMGEAASRTAELLPVANRLEELAALGAVAPAIAPGLARLLSSSFDPTFLFSTFLAENAPALAPDRPDISHSVHMNMPLSIPRKRIDKGERSR